MNEFYEKLLNPLQRYAEGEISLEMIRNSLKVINQYFFNTHKDIGFTQKGDTTPYFSEFHKLWETKAEEIVAPFLDEGKCIALAEVFHQLKIKYGDKLFMTQRDLTGISLDEFALIRFLTANQDFRGSRSTKDIIVLYRQDPTLFDISTIAQNSATFLKKLGISQLSQNDKREKFIEQTIKFLQKHDVDPAGIPDVFDNDALKIRQALIGNIGMGYGNKKTDMLIRDMYESRCWTNLINIDGIDVASDINTIKVALRTGILGTKLTPLLSSFLDIFCHQYGLMDEWNAKAWRLVWESWRDLHPDTVPYGPAYLDYFLYSVIGKTFCKDILYEYKGRNCGHNFFWPTGQVGRCVVCRDQFRNNTVTYVEEDGKLYAQCERFSEHKYITTSRRSKKCHICRNAELPSVIKIGRFLPCMKDEGQMCFGDLPITECPFIKVCKPREDSFKRLNPPKSISIYGQTGWESARADMNEGGGGLMA